MAEKLKEFVNTILTAADIVDGKLELLTTTATTQAVVKDVTVDTSVTNIKGTIVVNDTSVATLTTVSGSEIIDVSSNVKAALDPVPVAPAKSEKIMYSIKSTTLIKDMVAGDVQTAGNYDLLVPLDFDIKSFTDRTTATMNNPCWFYKKDNNVAYFYYDGNSTTNMYDGVVDGGGNVATWYAKDSTGYSYKTIDTEEDKIYYTHSGYVYSYDMVTGSTSTVSGSIFPGTSSYNKAAFCNGIFFTQPSSSYSDIYWYDTINDTHGIITYSRAAHSSNGGLAVTYNALEDTYYIMWWGGGQTFISSMSSDFATVTEDIYDEDDFGTLPLDGYGYRHGDTQGNFYYLTHSTYIPALAKVTSTTLTDTVIGSTAYGYAANAGIVAKDGTATQMSISDYDINLKVRVTGVEITGV